MKFLTFWFLYVPVKIDCIKLANHGVKGISTPEQKNQRTSVFLLHGKKFTEN